MGDARTAVWRWFGASVRGPAHEREGTPNQDAWLGRGLRTGGVVAVCDGMGSRKHAALGARAGCLAAAKAARTWARAGGAPVELLLRLVHDLWAVRVHPREKGDCAATCLLAAVPGDRLVVAQLGDGLAMVVPPGAAPVVLEGRAPEGFANLTTGLGVATSLRDWRWHEGAAEPGALVLLATDGVADDLVPERRARFAAHLRTAYGSLPAAKRWRQLAGELRKWPVPAHGDDKTVALLWSET